MAISVRLVTVGQGRLRFRHERLGRFLTAEALAVSSDDGAELGRALRQAAHRDLQIDALIFERDADRRYEALHEISDTGLFVDAVHGVFGPDTTRQVVADITALLVEAQIATTDGEAVLELPQPDGFIAHLRGGRSWSQNERALLAAAGTCVLDGIFVDEVCALFDATDQVLRRKMIELQEAGHRTAVSTVFAAAYSAYPVQFPREADALPATYVSGSADSSRIWAKRTELGEPVASRVWMDRSPSWGRAHLAALMSWPTRHPDDAQNLPDLIRAGWQLGGYHLRLELLESARYVRDFDDQIRERMVEVLNDLDTRYNVALSSLHVEVLARYGQIEPIRTLEDIQAAIADVLADVDNPEKQVTARFIVGSILDDETIVGPYDEAINSLPRGQRLDLLAMSVLAAGICAAYELAMRDLAEHAEHGSAVVRRAVKEAARMVQPQNVVRHEAVHGHLLGLRGWAKISAALPAPKPDDPGGAAYTAVWRLVDAPLFSVLRGEDPASEVNTRIWKDLLSTAAAPATAVFAEIRRAMVHIHVDDSGASFVPHTLMLEAYPDQLRQLME